MHIYDTLGARKFINAHDTYTIYGGSRLHPDTLSAMREAAEHFIDIHELQLLAGRRVAELTRNPDAYVTNGAAGGLLLAAAVLLSGGDRYTHAQLPDASRITRNEIIVLRCQRNAYDGCIAASGATIIDAGDAEKTTDWMLDGAITERTAGIFYFASRNYEKASMPLNTLIEIAKRRGVPVVVDAAAQLPPRENLWRFTNTGAAMAIFSGGKTLCGPQASGLIVGAREYIEQCRMFGAPSHGVCRACKVSKEDMVGLVTALERYMTVDEKAEHAALSHVADRFVAVFNATGLMEAFRVEHGPVGQAYPRAFGRLNAGRTEDWAAAMKAVGIYIGTDAATNYIYVSPLNLTEREADVVEEALLKHAEVVKTIK